MERRFCLGNVGDNFTFNSNFNVPYFSTSLSHTVKLLINKKMLN